MKKETSISIGIGLLGMGVFEYIASQSTRIAFLFGRPSSIVQKLFQRILDGSLIHNFAITGFEVIIGFVIGSLLGTILGFSLWYSKTIAEITKPFLFIMGIIPIVVFAPMIIIWFGIGISMKIALAAFSAGIICLYQAYHGAKSIHEKSHRILQTYGASRKDILVKIIIPSSISWVFASLHLAIGLALTGTVIGEFIAAQSGLGHYMFFEGSLYNMSGVFVGGIGIIALGMILYYGIRWLEHKKQQIITLISVTKKLR